jgi:hypothetical protein
MNCFMLATKLKQCNVMLHHFIASSLHCFKASGAQLCLLLFFTVVVLAISYCYFTATIDLRKPYAKSESGTNLMMYVY